MGQINYLEPIKYRIIENDQVVRESFIPRCILNLAMHKQKYSSVDRYVEFPDYNISYNSKLSLSVTRGDPTQETLS